MKTPDEIKKGLECCGKQMDCDSCPYHGENDCSYLPCEEGLVLIQQLEEHLSYTRKLCEQFEAQTPRWVPVTERQPTREESRRCYTVMERYRDVLVRKDGAYYDGYDWKWHNGDYQETVTVTHWLWMPELPEPEEV